MPDSYWNTLGRKRATALIENPPEFKIWRNQMFGQREKIRKGKSAYNVLSQDLGYHFDNKADVVNVLAETCGKIPALNLTELALYYLLDTYTGEKGDSAALADSLTNDERVAHLSDLLGHLGNMTAAERVSAEFWARWSPIVAAELVKLGGE
jgi:hypothetical protein